MTAIVALTFDNKVWMGGDSAGTDEYYSQNIRSDSKIFIKDDFIIGFTDSYRMGQILKYSVKYPKQPPTMSNEEYMCTLFLEKVRHSFEKLGYLKKDSEGQQLGGQFIVGYKNCIFIVYPDFQIETLQKNYAACGSGSDICLGSLFATENEQNPVNRIEKALEAASTFNASVRPPFIILHK